MKEPIWLKRDVLLAVHERLLAEHGGQAGIRDEGLFDSALNRPQNAFSYQKPTLYELAAAYAFGIVKNHPFLDGNKRTGFMAAYLFLGLNGVEFAASESDVVLQTVALAEGKQTEKEYAAFLEGNSTSS